MPGQVEDVHHAFPYRLALESLVNRNGLGERRGAAVQAFDGKTVWEGVVHVFDLAEHPTATRAYAWSSPIEGSTKRRFFAVLHTARINSPLEAVRAAIVAESKTR